jgi:ribosomal protein L34
LPDERFVPGTVRGRLSGSLADHVRIRLGDGAAGVLEIDGTQPVAATSYRRLGFDNRARTGSGRVVLVIGARAYAVAPLRLEWRSP